MYRRLEEIARGAFDGLGGPEAVERVADRLVDELGDELGLRSVRVLREAGEAGAHHGALHAVRVETGRGPCVLGFEPSKGAEPERVELVLSALTSILSARLLESAFGNTMRQAEEIQRSLLPQAPPRFAGYEIATRSLPAEEVGGDLHDFLELDEDTLGLAVGDASGHGLPAALLARDVVVGLRMGMEKELKAGHTLSRLNQVIHTSALSSCFVSLFFAELESNGSLFYFNAGHEPPLLFDANGVTSLARGDTVIGPLTNARFKRHFAHLDHGATLVLHTDGLVERRDRSGALFGVDRLAAAVRARLERSPEGIVAHVFEEAEAFGGGRPWEDDATLVVVRRLP